MRALVVVEGHPFPDGRLCLRSGLPGMQVDALVFQGAPQPLDEDVVEETAFPICYRQVIAGNHREASRTARLIGGAVPSRRKR